MRPHRSQHPSFRQGGLNRWPARKVEIIEGAGIGTWLIVVVCHVREGERC
jgi:hypothetical protein